MCANYRPSTRDHLRKHFGVAPLDSEFKAEAYPGHIAPLIRLTHADAVPGDRACALGMFGMVPHWADTKLARQTYNARTETVATKPDFRNAYKRRQYCVIPANSFYEPSYGTGKAERWEIANFEGGALGIAGIWEYKQDGSNGLPLLSFSMLTVNADGHAVMQRFHKRDDEKRMLVILSPDQYDDWLTCRPEDTSGFFARYPAERLVTYAAPTSNRTTAQASLLDV